MKFDETKFAKESRLSPRDLDTLSSIPAVFANQYSINAQNDGVVRIVFSDINPDTGAIFPRASIAMTAYAFRAFAELIANNLDQQAKQLVEVNRVAPTADDKEKLN